MACLTPAVEGLGANLPRDPSDESQWGQSVGQNRDPHIKDECLGDPVLRWLLTIHRIRYMRVSIWPIKRAGRWREALVYCYFDKY